MKIDEILHQHNCNLEHLAESNTSVLGSSAVEMVHLEGHLHEGTAMIAVT